MVAPNSPQCYLLSKSNFGIKMGKEKVVRWGAYGKSLQVATLGDHTRGHQRTKNWPLKLFFRASVYATFWFAFFSCFLFLSGLQQKTLRLLLLNWKGKLRSFCGAARIFEWFFARLALFCLFGGQQRLFFPCLPEPKWGRRRSLFLSRKTFNGLVSSTKKKQKKPSSPVFPEVTAGKYGPKKSSSLWT